MLVLITSPYVAGLTSFLCFAFCFALMLMLSCEPGFNEPFTQAIFVAIFLLLMHAIKWIDFRMYYTICAKLYKSTLF